jgi:hypothetical protein
LTKASIQHEPRRARDYYAEALAKSPGNRPAIFNLSVLDLVVSYEDPGESAEQRARQARFELEGLRASAGRISLNAQVSGIGRATTIVRHMARQLSSQPPAWDDTFWYRATYMLAADVLHRSALRRSRSSKSGTGRDSRVLEELETARDRALELVAAIVSSLYVRGAWTKTLRLFLADIEGPSLVLLAGVLLETAPLDDHRPRPWKRRGQARWRRTVAYHLGAGWRYVPDQKLGGVVLLDLQRSDRVISPRTRYNLACYYTALGDAGAPPEAGPHYQRAFAELRRALDGAEPALLQWAQKDPSLRSLQTSKQQWSAVLREAKEQQARRTTSPRGQQSSHRPGRRFWRPWRGRSSR